MLLDLLEALGECLECKVCLAGRIWQRRHVQWPFHRHIIVFVVTASEVQIEMSVGPRGRVITAIEGTLLKRRRRSLCGLQRSVTCHHTVAEWRRRERHGGAGR